MKSKSNREGTGEEGKSRAEDGRALWHKLEYSASELGWGLGLSG